MNKRNAYTVGLDIGTNRVKCVVGESAHGGFLNIIGVGEAEARGLRKGVVVNPDSAVESIRSAVAAAELMSGVEATEVTLNLAGSHILGVNGQAVVAVSSHDREISVDDVRRVIDSACAIQLPAGREIVDRLPQEFIVDDQDGINDPVGMIGARLAVKVHIVTSPMTARQNAINAVNRAGLIVTDMVLEQLAAAEAVLSNEDKEFGAALVNIGSETTGLLIYQRGAVQHTAVFALGGAHFTNDIAFGLRTPIPEAERIKRAFGCCYSPGLSEAERGEIVDVPSVGGRPPRQLSRQILSDILQPRAEEVLQQVADEIKMSGWDRQISSGVVITGGGALLGGLADVAEQVFDAPVRIGCPEQDRFTGLIEDSRRPVWATAAGLCLMAHRSVSHTVVRERVAKQGAGASKWTYFVSHLKNKFSGIF